MLLLFLFKLAKVPRVKRSIGRDHRSQKSAKHPVDLHASKPLISAIGPYNLHYLLFSGMGALLCHHPYCFPSQSQTLFGIGAARSPITQPSSLAFSARSMIICPVSEKSNFRHRAFENKNVCKIWGLKERIYGV